MESTTFKRAEYVIYDYSSILKRMMGKVIDIALILCLSTFLAKLKINLYLIIIYFLLEYLYSVLGVYFFGQTAGMWIVGAKVVSVKSEKVSMGQAITRGFGIKLSDTFIGIGNIWIIFNDSCQAWHDLLAGTIVVNKKNAEKVQQFLGKNPWSTTNKYNIIKYIGVAISITIVLYTSFDNLVNRLGKLGMLEKDTYRLSGRIIDTKLGKLDEELNGLMALTVSEDAMQLNIYKTSNRELLSPMAIEVDSTSALNAMSLDFEVCDLDGDDKGELILSQVYKEGSNSLGELTVYKSIGESLEPVAKLSRKEKDSFLYQSKVIVTKDSNNNPLIVWMNNQELITATFSGKEVIEQNSSSLPTVNNTIVAGDFYGTGEKKAYIIQRFNENLGLSLLGFGSSISMKNVGEISDKLEYIADINNNIIRTGDIDNDGKDEIMLMDDENKFRNNKLLSRKYNPWLNIYKYDKGNWEKIWTGGNMIAAGKDKYKLNMDVDNDNINEIVMVKASNINTYEYNKGFFKLNTLWQRIDEIREKLTK